MGYNNIFDSHSHYDDKAFDDDREELLSTKLKEGGVSGVIHACAYFENVLDGVLMAEKHDFMYSSVGVHPEECENLPENYISVLRDIALSHKKVVAIGEIGLDYHYDGFDRDFQIKIFKEQLSLAKELSLPVIIHSRDATGDMMEILREYRPCGVMHCFSGSAETAKEVLSLGMYLGFTGVVTFKNAKKAIEAVSVTPVDRLLLETDCPYMAPEPFRGKRCDSRLIEYTAEKIAEIKGVPTQEMIDIANENTKRLFGIKM